MKPIYFLTLFGFICLFSNCSNPKSYQTLNGDSIQMNDSLSIYIFLNTECPICQKYQGSFRNMNFHEQSVYYVFAGVQDKNSIVEMCKYDSIDPSKVLIDSEYELTKSLKATVSPEAIIRFKNQIVYTGLIDDRFSVIGASKPFASINYIENALNSLHKNEAIKIPYTKAVGCFIEPN